MSEGCRAKVPDFVPGTVHLGMFPYEAGTVMMNKGYFILSDIPGYTEFRIQKLEDREEQLEENVIVPHRMLKNIVIGAYNQAAAGLVSILEAQKKKTAEGEL